MPTMVPITPTVIRRTPVVTANKFSCEDLLFMSLKVLLSILEMSLVVIAADRRLKNRTVLSWMTEEINVRNTNISAATPPMIATCF